VSEKDGDVLASAAFVAFHNVVTSSVPDTKYLIGQQRRFYCVRTVIQNLPGEFVDDLDEQVDGLGDYMSRLVDYEESQAIGVAGVDPSPDAVIVSCQQ
jgi:hypothetical protein